jgi:hypothetical protein
LADIKLKPPSGQRKDILFPLVIIIGFFVRKMMFNIKLILDMAIPWSAKDVEAGHEKQFTKDLT